MNGPIKMYKLKPVVSLDVDVVLPNCMYKIKNIHASNGQPDCKSSSDNLDTFKQNQEITPEMVELEQRQRKILQQLAQLKNHLNRIRTNLHSQFKTAPKPEQGPKSDKIQINNFPSDIIINASPRNPPISLIVLRSILKNNIDFSVKVHQHSSVISVGETARKFVKSLEDRKGNPELPRINLRLIWKDIGTNLELMVSHTVVQGEVNFLRYVARLFPNLLCYENSPDVGKIDNLLDVSYRLVKAKTKTERASLLQIFNKSLGKEEFLVGSKYSLADLAVYSAIKQVSGCELTNNLSKWLARCENF